MLTNDQVKSSQVMIRSSHDQVKRHKPQATSQDIHERSRSLLQTADPHTLLMTLCFLARFSSFSCRSFSGRISFLASRAFSKASSLESGRHSPELRSRRRFFCSSVRCGRFLRGVATIDDDGDAVSVPMASAASLSMASAASLPVYSYFYILRFYILHTSTLSVLSCCL